MAFHTLPLFHLRTKILCAFAGKNYATVEINAEGLFQVSRNFYVRTCVKFTFANKIEIMHERSLVSVKVELRHYFNYVIKIYVR